MEELHHHGYCNQAIGSKGGNANNYVCALIKVGGGGWGVGGECISAHSPLHSSVKVQSMRLLYKWF